ncbi:MAG: hypothetical protein ACYYK0_00930 [Candidatus Eutrophobiaceae bacterium]
MGVIAYNGSGRLRSGKAHPYIFLSELLSMALKISDRSLIEQRLGTFAGFCGPSIEIHNDAQILNNLHIQGVLCVSMEESDQHAGMMHKVETANTFEHIPTMSA